MKKIFIFMAAVALLAVAACNDKKADNSSATEALYEQTLDSLLVANAERDSLLSIINEINEGMAQIREVEKLISSKNLATETPDKKEEIKNNMVLIQQALKERREKLAQLERQLRNSKGGNSELQSTIDGLRKQLDEQEATIKRLTEELGKANIKIEELNMTVDSLNIKQQELEAQRQAIEDQKNQLDAELNTCYYVIGSKKELKDNKIIETGFLRKTKVLESDYEIGYFTKGDKRTLVEIPLHSTKAKVLTKHADDSYEIVDVNGAKLLHIINKDKFWEVSNFLVVQVD